MSVTAWATGNPSRAVEGRAQTTILAIVATMFGMAFSISQAVWQWDLVLKYEVIVGHGSVSEGLSVRKPFLTEFTFYELIDTQKESRE